MYLQGQKESTTLQRYQGSRTEEQPTCLAKG